MHFPVNFAKLLRTTFLLNTSGLLVLLVIGAKQIHKENVSPNTGVFKLVLLKLF